jgi:hypothetical protein
VALKVVSRLSGIDNHIRWHEFDKLHPRYQYSKRELLALWITYVPLVTRYAQDSSYIVGADWLQWHYKKFLIERIKSYEQYPNPSNTGRG